MDLFKRFRKSDSGATSIEYGLLTALVVVVAIPAITVVGCGVSNKLTQVATALESAQPAAPGPGDPATPATPAGGATPPAAGGAPAAN